MKTYTFTTPLSISTGLNSSLTVKSVQITSMNFNQAPPLAQIGTGVLDVTVMDPATDFQQTFSYKDASVRTFWTAEVTPVQGQTFEDLAATALFNKLIADGKLPAGTLA